MEGMETAAGKLGCVFPLLALGLVAVGLGLVAAVLGLVAAAAFLEGFSVILRSLTN